MELRRYVSIWQHEFVSDGIALRGCENGRGDGSSRRVSWLLRGGNSEGDRRESKYEQCREY